MSFMLGCESISLSYPAKALFKEATIGVSDGDRIGVVGLNGEGKSTLLDIIAGITEVDAGQVTRRRNLEIAYLEQEDHLDDDATVYHEILGSTPEYVWASDPRIRDILVGLVGDIDGDTVIGTLSGGQRRRVDLARVLVSRADLLLLDEPTNHLDLVAITWLAHHLASRLSSGNGAFIAVTHDRWFLDTACGSTWEVHDGIIEPFEGGFSAYVLQRVERDEAARVAEQKRQNHLRRELAWLSRGARARSSKPRFHLQTARELIANVPELRDPIALKRIAVQRLGKQVVDFLDVGFSYGDQTVLDDVTWSIGPGDRYGLLGMNGAGKTTVVELISGTIRPTHGRVRIGATVKMAVLSQNLSELAGHEEERVREIIGRYKTGYEVEGHALSPAQMLERLGFDKRHLSNRACELSGGQRRRLQLLLTLLEGPNVLILDEPSNDMDTEMLSVMEDLLDTWPGTLILITHDRYLMERVTDDQFALIDGKIVHMPRGVEQYLSLVDGMTGTRAPSPSPASQPVAESPGAGLSNSEIRVLRKQVASLERKMATLEERIASARTTLHGLDPTDYLSLGAQQETIAGLERERNGLEDEWLEAMERLEG